MGGFFAVASKDDCVRSLFYGTDYHCHLGTRRGGLATLGEDGFKRYIHDITNAQFQSKFESDIFKMQGKMGIGVISDYEDQPLIISSHLGRYAIATVGVVKNADELIKTAFSKRGTHFSEMSIGEVNPTELIATLINQEDGFEEGIRKAQQSIEGSCSLLLLTEEGIYVARDRLGRTPVVIGSTLNGYAATMESCAFPNLGFKVDKYLGPGEIVFISPDGIEQKIPPGDEMQICSFLWIYYGYPASSYEGINVEATRYRCGAALAENDDVEVDYVAGIPDSGIAHALGYAAKANIHYRRPFVKYTPTWSRSFMPQDQSVRDLIAKMKLIPIRELTEGQRLLFCEDSIVRGTQLKDTIQRMFDYGASEVHMRPACPPLIFACKFLNFSRSHSELDLAGRKAISELEGKGEMNLEEYTDESSDKYHAMVTRVGQKMGLTSLKYQRLDDMVKAIGLPKERLCTYCWSGCDRPE
ncbi:MAG: amidophosphoribosyltransferase [Candidatus Latescibacteria bacterium]|nr:amidophosphoribosyltransferase [Candidatus Latescibacterota bacterium]NIO28998.1 amidophosphoribosyltransferase [Candidatus Latescibacterota bacterium]NIO56623.1 amidophosphoribosyltransferase [Candidatus Latescibacterota bacterium]NIT02207.1 amidophosphoribosyltransferase [Candidatus Latescibacterota bacterium]NIT39092.1 amidophosphoribosyltransferase [Candidatus Latescibacterota bacterium]